MNENDGRHRVVVEGLSPDVDCGRFPAKRIVGEPVVIEADVFADGHDQLTAVLSWWPERDEGARTDVAMEALGNDRWRACFVPEELGRYRYSVKGWIDRFGTWAAGLRKKLDAEQDVTVDVLVGAELVAAASKRATGRDAEVLKLFADHLGRDLRNLEDLAFDPELAQLMDAYPDTSLAGELAHPLTILADRPRARFGAWYEMFPRSAAAPPQDPTGPPRHGTFADVERRLSYVAGMGFDVLYLPPIHPIGLSHRKGRNNTEQGGPDDPGSPWAIGGKEGGHQSIHPDLGTLEDFDRLVAAAGRFGLEVALDFAIQCSPDHPWVREHPEWFRRRPDGTLQYAENPPKRYQDIYPVDFETDAWEELWEELHGVLTFWIDHGIRIFRVDNPHTKAFAFWEWVIGEVKAAHPEVLFLAEAFTRPKVMYRLAKLGFTQSYTYFTWRTSKTELTEYFTELATPPVSDFFQPNLWPNTPDILAMQLQDGGRPGFIARLVLAATLGSSYGIYGPTFELGENTPAALASEEYLNSEKYEIRSWDLTRTDSLSELIAQVNRARRQNPALQVGAPPLFQLTDNPELIAYAKSTAVRSTPTTSTATTRVSPPTQVAGIEPAGEPPNIVLTVVNLDPRNVQSGWLTLDLVELGIPDATPYVVEDLLTGSRFSWTGSTNFIRLDPATLPAHILSVTLPPKPAAPVED
ncbi:MAG TPA: alpha-1,4-glucan--maltose-1-phosphate maltosyltransferase [Actinomycetota bacterium]|nr:alpha-1,4-glucan--maltose-1-phosphate maltosyltransferase [Actinomycetota bacterium]